MGMFSKKKTYIESTSVGVFDEVADNVKQSIMSSIVQDRSISDDLIANGLHGLGTKAKTFYRYGRDSFYHGLPEGTVEIHHANIGAVQLVVELIEGEPVDMTFSIFTYADAWHFTLGQINPAKTTENAVWIDDTTVLVVYTDTTEEYITVPSTDITMR